MSDVHVGSYSMLQDMRCDPYLKGASAVSRMEYHQKNAICVLRKVLRMDGT